MGPIFALPSPPSAHRLIGLIGKSLESGRIAAASRNLPSCLTAIDGELAVCVRSDYTSYPVVTLCNSQ